jgi:hypothetical protein
MQCGCMPEVIAHNMTIMQDNLYINYGYKTRKLTYSLLFIDLLYRIKSKMHIVR